MKKKIVPILTVGALILIIVLILFLSHIIKKYTPSDEHEDLTEYYNISEEDQTALILNEEVLEEKGLLIGDVVYLDIATIQKYLNSRFYWDSKENKLLYVTASDLISVDAESTDYYVTKNKNSFSHIIVKVDATTAYVAVDFITQYTNLSYTFFDSPNRLVLTSEWGDYETTTVKRDTEIRHKGGIKSPILADVTKGTILTLLETDETWSKVMTEDGIIGYIKNKTIADATTATCTNDFTEEVHTHITKDFEINLGWHQVTNQAANNQIASVLSSTKGINVISPTWFYLNDNNGGIASLANSDYVNYCHQNGVEVWALVSNLENPDVSTSEVLTYTSKRETLINNLISAAIQYNLDGINVDFESLSAEEVGDSYIEFIRELSLKCANNGIVLSVDNYVPSDYTAFYNRAEQAVFADYVIIMAYDEHYYGSEEEGSVASIGFVSDGVTNTLKEVPAEQTILGIPFYARVWVETPAEDSSETEDDSYVLYNLDSYAASMTEVQKLISANGAVAAWSEADGQYYVEYENGGSIYKIWVEDATSIEEKLKVMDENKLAGAAFWKLGLEDSTIWDTILKYIN
ncbi:MAG: glycosyl hydrolase family 18 protein [Roseburia sp.]